MILLQYLPYAWDLLTRARGGAGQQQQQQQQQQRRHHQQQHQQHQGRTPLVEGGVLGAAALAHGVVVPLLSDSALMDELPDGLLANLLFPAAQLAASRTGCFHGGWRARQTLAFR